VVFEPDDVVVPGQPGELLLDLAGAAGIPLLSECGGQGTCGSCRVLVQRGRVSFADQAGREEEITAPREVLACQTAAAGDLVVRIPPEARLRPLHQRITGYLGPEARVYLQEPHQGMPLARRLALELAPPSFDDPTPDWERLAMGLRHACGAERNLTANLDVLREMPRLLRELDFKVSVTVLDEGWQDRLIALGKPDGDPLLGLALDIGTTNIKAELVDLGSGRVLGGASEFNAQARYGEDVISRIIWAQEHEWGADELQDALVTSVNTVIGELLKQTQAAQEQIVAVSCAGNATMISFRLRLPADAIRRAPHVAPVGLPPTVQAGMLGLDTHPAAGVYCLPAINGYVGGDISGGILATGMFAAEDLRALVDVGTNGEIVVGNRDWRMCCACSAGPAFEGMGIECGLPARPGAIESLRYESEHDCVDVRTIGEELPVGVCGNGLAETLATLLDAQVIDRAGNLVAEFPSPRMRQADGEMQFVLLWSDQNATGRDLVLRQSEIDNLIRAKAAVFAALVTLLEELGLSTGDIGHFYLAGAFGSHLDVRTAIKIGLLPDLPAERVTVAGNTALAGAYLTLLSSEARDEIQKLARATTYMDLSTSSRFMEEYIAAQMLPHTNLERFPSLAPDNAGPEWGNSLNR
jgi:uncharacterized 2Fe-2S/4Fe-4S cluster protein (DUF4445 family)